VFILVRHAVAVAKQKWDGADRLRPLISRGTHQSHDLVPLLTRHGVTRLLSSPAVRCRSTLTPASTELGVPVETRDALGVNAPIDGLLALLDSAEVENAALCTHGETFASLFGSWSRRWPDGSVPPDLAHTPKGGSWVIENYGSAGMSARYLGVSSGHPDPVRSLA